MTTHQTYEARLITALLALVCVIGCAGAIVPAVEQAVTLGLLTPGPLVVLAVAVRLGVRWLRERREDRADALTAAAWRAEHAPHLVGVA
ncbi:hypothetical protein I4I73_17400 [Pseudonocardia sp. KRD-184]|uniref:Uncharacterized protein n=1 Tax=Pseudonocardia oceani TaxID=2792013 RepID=A0ABS6U8M5_9PSEU|nr:hypothetical protein [Pseudonocardia oceani]MBW0090637.1 hypothetical protein [Pseudonocardia oceani]MBW0097757.1 hypothetical protein [Pseudonocardia oceani]MBW0108569.1 hypothetical protein [Pseudonocardia oceani]MBW0122327.1 hypothetical protein [Pseudonocardia oceani]MBW0128585.1 hypothetical protein [Pseudonocardia oceani]